jgi:hypothetical protein
MDAIGLLRSDHDEVRAMFEEFRAAKEADDGERMRSLQQQIFDELETHTREDDGADGERRAPRREEESEMFPDRREHMSDQQLDELGSKLEAAKTTG